MKMRIYDMRINAEDETGVDINSFVDAPAHVSSFETYSKNKISFAVDTEKRIVTGVFIMADLLIYRNDKQLGEHFVKFSPETIWDIRNKFFKKGFNVNTNTQHDKIVKGAILVDSFIVHSTDPRFPKVPEILSNQKIKDGSWIGSYYIENEQLWQDCKNGIFRGFSVEGYFDKTETQIKTNMKKDAKKTSIFKNIFGVASSEETMMEATTVDGIVIFYEGELAVGTMVEIEVDGKKMAATKGDHQVEIEGMTYAISLDEEGKVATMEEVAVMSEEATALSAAVKKIYTDANSKFVAMQKEIDQLKSDLRTVQSGNQFSADGKKSQGIEKKGFKALLS